MEKAKSKKKSRRSEFLVVAIVVVCALLILADLSSNVIEEIGPREVQAQEGGAVPTPTDFPAVRPTRAPDYTPEVLDMDA